MKWYILAGIALAAYVVLRRKKSTVGVGGLGIGTSPVTGGSVGSAQAGSPMADFMQQSPIDAVGGTMLNTLQDAYSAVVGNGEPIQEPASRDAAVYSGAPVSGDWVDPLAALADGSE